MNSLWTNIISPVFHALGEVLELEPVSGDEAVVAGGLEGFACGVGACAPAGGTSLGGVPLYTPRRGPTWDTGTLQVRGLKLISGTRNLSHLVVSAGRGGGT